MNAKITMRLGEEHDSMRGEGIGVERWRADLSPLHLIVAYGLASIMFGQLLKSPMSTSRAPSTRSTASRVACTRSNFRSDGLRVDSLSRLMKRWREFSYVRYVRAQSKLEHRFRYGRRSCGAGPGPIQTALARAGRNSPR